MTVDSALHVADVLLHDPLGLIEVAAPLMP
jgi:hypothetical protein